MRISDPDLEPSISLDRLVDAGFDVAAEPAAKALPEPSQAPLWHLITARLTPRQVEILSVVFSSSSRAQAARILETSPANVRVQMANIRDRVSDVITYSSSAGAIYGPSTKG